MQRVRKAHAVEDAVVQQVEERPDDIGNQDRAEALFHEGLVIERLVDVEIVEEPKGRDEEENRHAEARDDLKERNQVKIRRLVHQILRTDVDGDDAHHGDAADVLDGR